MAGTAEDADRIDLTELDVITRYSLAVRHATADRDELIEALRADLAWLESGRQAPAPRTRSAARTTTARTTTAGTTAARKTAARRTTTRRAR